MAFKKDSTRFLAVTVSFLTVASAVSQGISGATVKNLVDQGAKEGNGLWSLMKENWKYVAVTGSLGLIAFFVLLYFCRKNKTVKETNRRVVTETVLQKEKSGEIKNDVEDIHGGSKEVVKKENKYPLRLKRDEILGCFDEEALVQELENKGSLDIARRMKSIKNKSEDFELEYDEKENFLYEVAENGEKSIFLGLNTSIKRFDNFIKKFVENAKEKNKKREEKRKYYLELKSILLKGDGNTFKNMDSKVRNEILIFEDDLDNLKSKKRQLEKFLEDENKKNLGGLGSFWDKLWELINGKRKHLALKLFIDKSEVCFYYVDSSGKKLAKDGKELTDFENQEYECFKFSDDMVPFTMVFQQKVRENDLEKEPLKVVKIEDNETGGVNFED